MKKVIAVLLAVMLMVGVLAGCGGTTTQTPGGNGPATGGDPSGKTIAVCMGSMNHPVHRVVQMAFLTTGDDMGYNAIIGGHPHVIQPAAVLTGSNGNKTFCIYSTGNMVSNQRREFMSASPNGYTEDAIFVYTTFERDNEGNVKLASVDYTPLWMNKSGSSYKLEACKGDNLTASQQSSKNRTDGLVAEGFNAWGA